MGARLSLLARGKTSHQELTTDDSSSFALFFGCWYRVAAGPMKKILASIVTTVLIVAMTLAAMYILVWATVKVTSLESPLHRAGAMGAELLLGVVLLLGTTWLATH